MTQENRLKIGSHMPRFLSQEYQNHWFTAASEMLIPEEKELSMKNINYNRGKTVL